MDNIIVKAADSDNELEIKGIIDLFTCAFGANFPNKAVYRPDFWHKHMSSRFTSLIALQGHKIVGHLALQPGRLCPYAAQCLLPAFEPAIESHLNQLSLQAWQIIEKQAKRRGWRLAYFCEYQEFPILQKVTNESFNTVPVALVPQMNNLSLEQGCPEESARTALVTVRMFNHAAPSGKPAPLFVPAEHIQICSRIYGRLGLARQFLTENAPQPAANYAFPADACAVDKRPGGAEFGAVFVHPSLIGDWGRFDYALSAAKTRSMMMVDMQDPACPSFCDKLAMYGYNFCGVLPFLYGHECVLYSRFEYKQPDARILYSAQARDLAEYILAHSSAVSPGFLSGSKERMPGFEASDY